MIHTIPAPNDFSFHETIQAHGWLQLAPFTWDEQTATLNRIERLPDGAVVELAMRDAAPGGLQITVSGPADAREVISRVRTIFQLDLPIDGFHAYCRTRPELAHIPARKQGRMLVSPTLFEDTLKVIATANTTWAQTKLMAARLCEHFGAPLTSDPTRRAFPAARDIAAVPFDEFAAKARMGYRNAYVHSIATSIVNGELDLEAWTNTAIPATDLRKRLLSLPGIGPYGSSCLMLYLGKPEHVNVDSWARMMLSKELDRPVTDKEVFAYFADHGAWRGLVYNFYPWQTTVSF